MQGLLYGQDAPNLVEERVNYPFTWKGKVGHWLWETRRDLEKAALSPTEKNIDDAFAWTELFLVKSAITIRKLGKSGNIDDEIFHQELTARRFDLDDLPPETLDKTHGDLSIEGEGIERNIQFNTLLNEIIHSSVITACKLPSNPNPIGALLIGCRGRIEGNKGTPHLLLVDLESLFDSIESVVRESFDYDKNTGHISLYEKE